MKYHSSEEYLYWQGDRRSDLIWVIQQGRVELLDGKQGEETLHDVAGAGDVIGLDSLIGDGRLHYSARTSCDVIVYCLSTTQFADLAAKYPEVERYLKARFSVEGWSDSSRKSWLDAEPPPVSFLEVRNAQPSSNGIPLLEAPYSTRSALALLMDTRSPAIRIGDTVLTARDLALFINHDPTSLIAELSRSASPLEARAWISVARRMLNSALAGAEDIEDCCRLASHLLQAAIHAAIRAASAGLSAPTTPHCWILFGAAARCDTPGFAFPTLAAVYDDRTGNAASYFGAVAAAAGHWLEQAGLGEFDMRWPRGVRPGMTLSEWKQFYTVTIQDPIENSIYERRELFDIAALSGDAAILAELEAHIAAELSSSSLAVVLLANDTVSHVPPLTFFEGLVIDLDGARRESFNIDYSLVSPVADAVRVFALSLSSLSSTSTLARFKHMAAAAPQHARALSEAADAFRIGLLFRMRAGSAEVHPKQLSRADQILLRTAIASAGRFLEHTVKTFVETQ